MKSAKPGPSACRAARHKGTGGLLYTYFIPRPWRIVPRISCTAIHTTHVRVPGFTAQALVFPISVTSNSLKVRRAKPHDCRFIKTIKILSRPRLASPHVFGAMAVRRADLSSRGLYVVPSDVLDNTSLVTLILSDNNLQSLPKRIGELHELRELYLDQNALVDLPVELCQLRKLQRLSVGGNPKLCEDLLAVYDTCPRCDTLGGKGRNPARLLEYLRSLQPQPSVFAATPYTFPAWIQEEMASSKCCDDEPTSRYPIHQVCSLGHGRRDALLEVLNTLHTPEKLAIAVNEVDTGGFTPLMILGLQQLGGKHKDTLDPEDVQVLLDAGASIVVRAPGVQLSTVIHHCVKSHHIRALKHLLPVATPADLEAGDSQGHTALMWAVSGRAGLYSHSKLTSFSLVQLLIEAGASPLAVSPSTAYETSLCPLSIAVRRGAPELVAILLACIQASQVRKATNQVKVFHGASQAALPSALLEKLHDTLCTMQHPRTLDVGKQALGLYQRSLSKAEAVRYESDGGSSGVDSWEDWLARCLCSAALLLLEPGADTCELFRAAGVYSVRETLAALWSQHVHHSCGPDSFMQRGSSAHGKIGCAGGAYCDLLDWDAASGPPRHLTGSQKRSELDPNATVLPIIYGEMSLSDDDD